MKDEWIKATNALPGERVDVLAWNEESPDSFYIAYFEDGQWIDAFDFGILNITHWQHLYGAN